MNDLKMKLLLLLVLIALTPCYARMGWTKQQMEAKYGEHTKIKNIPGTAFKMYMYEISRKDLHYLVFATYVQDKVRSVSYVNDQRDWSKAEIKAILKLNAEGGHFDLRWKSGQPGGYRRR